jgi:hypothetical protein
MWFRLDNFPNKMIKPFATLTRTVDRAVRLATPSLATRPTAAYHCR